MVFDAGAIEARLILNRQQFQQELAAAKAEGANFEKNRFEAHLDADPTQAAAAIEKIQAAFDQLKTDLERRNSIDVDNAEAIAKILEAEALFEQFRGALEQNIALKANFTDLTSAINDITGHLGNRTQNVGVDVTVNGANEATQQLDRVASESTKAAHAAAQAGGAVGFLAQNITLWGGAFGSIHMLGAIQGWHIVLDAALEATIAVTAATVALTETAIVAAPSIDQVIHRLRAIDQASNAFGQHIPPVTGHLQEMAHAFASLSIEALGGVSNFATGGGHMLRTAMEVGTGIDDIIAKLDLWNQAQKHTGVLSQLGVEVVHQLETVVGDLFLALNNLAKADPGTVHVLLDLVVFAGKVVEELSKIPAPILATVLAIHSFTLWGGLLTTGLTKLIPAGLLTQLKALPGAFGGAALAAGNFVTTTKEMRDLQAIPLTDLRTGAQDAEKQTSLLSRSFSGLLGVLASPGVILAAGAALAYVAYESEQADSATKAFIANIESNVSAASANQAIGTIATSIGALNNQIQSVVNDPNFQKAFQQFEAPFQHLGDIGKNAQLGKGNAVNQIKSLWDTITSLFAHGPATPALNLVQVGQAGADIGAFRGEIEKLTKDQIALFQGVGSIMNVHTISEPYKESTAAIMAFGQQTHKVTVESYSFSQAIALMGLAGVKAGDSFDLIKQKVKNLITGWNEMAISGGILNEGVNAITFSSELQQSQIQTLTAAWTSFLGVVSGGDTAFIAFQQAMITTANASHVAGASITGLNTQSLTLRQNWEQSLSAAGAYYNALATQAAASGLGAKGTALLTQAGKDLIAQLIPQARHSQVAAEQLYAFAQIAGYQGPDSLKKLTEWLGNTKDAAKNLDGITTTLTADSANLVNDVQNLATAINQNLNQAMAAALFQASGGQTAFDNFANAVIGAHGNVKLMQASANALGTELIATLGSTKLAQGEFFAFAYQLGLTKTQAQELWSQLQKIPTSQQETLTISGIGTYNISSSGARYGGTGPGSTGGGAPGVPAAAAGMMVTGGIAGRDSVLVMAKPGELIVPTELVNAGFADNMRGMIPGFATGGIVGSYRGNLGGLGAWAYNETQDTLHAMVSNVVSDTAAAIKAATAAASASAATAAANQFGGLSASSGYQAFKVIAALRGWGPGLLQDWVNVEMREAGFDLHAQNPTSGAYGMAQFINGPSEYYTYGGNPYTYLGQALAMANYMDQRYGGPAGAWSHEVNYGWYDRGGLLRPGTVAMNGTGMPEYVLPPSATQALMDFLQHHSGGKRPDALIGTYNTNYYGTGDVREAMNELLFTLRRANMEL